MRTRLSLRWRLAATYAGIALLTAVVLGGLLVWVLADYYAQAEDGYLSAAAHRVTENLTRSDALPSDLATQAAISALDSQTRVRVYSTSGKLLADSGSPSQIDPSALFARPSQPGSASPGPSRPASDAVSPPSSSSSASPQPRGQPLPAPLGNGLFSSESSSTPRSSRTLTTVLKTSSGVALGTLTLSEGPASGSDVLTGVVEALMLAALAAVLASAVAGYMLSRQISEPLAELTGVADRMAAGDLTARATVSGTDEVGRLSASFNGMAERMEQTITALRRFVADAAHEIGTPLTALHADLELAETSIEPGDGLRFVRRALTQAYRLEHLSSGLLSLSRLESGDAMPTDASADLSSAVRTAVDAAASRAEQKDVELLAAVDENAARARGDEHAFATIIDSLLDNAIKFTPSGGTVEVGLRTEGDSAVLWVSDTGIGIPETEQAGVFERFYRARNVPDYAGSGLGLAIVRATVERLDGAIGFTSSPKGTRFEVRLPLA
jgi:signal transduction histidine kinase